MNAFIAGTRTIAGLELRQRVRSSAWYVLLGIFAVVLLVVTVLAGMTFSSSYNQYQGTYSVVVFFVLLLVTLVTPALSGNAINGDRDAATLAPVQVTLVSTAQIVVGKLLAAWATGLAFVAVAVPFLVFTGLAGSVSAGTVIVSIAVLIAEIGVIAAFGVGLSGVLNRPLFSVVTTYLVVAALTIGTLIAFGLGGSAVRTEVTTTQRYYEGSYIADDGSAQCTDWVSSTYEAPRFDLVWGFLAANPFVILADATPIEFDNAGNAVDLFGQISAGVRFAQIAPESEVIYDGCDPNPQDDYTTAEEVHAETVPSWFVGLAIQVVLAGGVLLWAYSRTRTPAGRLPRGTRIA